MKGIVETYITYKWEEQSEAIVAEIEAKLKYLQNVRVYRDKRSIRYLDSIETFMEKLRHGDIVVMVVSDQYLHSLNCMYEMSGLFKDGSYKDRVFPVMIDTSIRDGEYYLGICNYWKEELSKLKKLILNSDSKKSVIEPFQKDVKKMNDILSSIPHLFEYCRETNVPSVEEMRKDEYAEFIERIEERTDRLRNDSQMDESDLDRLILEIKRLSEPQFIKVVTSYKADYSDVKESGFDGRAQSANPTFIIEDTPMAICAILYDLQEEIGEEEVANIRYSSAKHHREYRLRTISDTLKIVRRE